MTKPLVDRLAAVLILESTKIALDHLATHRMTVQEAAQDSRAYLTRLYGDMRRLRDHLNRCIAGAPERVELDLEVGDVALLVAALRRHHQVIDHRLVGAAELSVEEKSLLHKKRQTLGDLAVALAVKPVIELPLPTIGLVGTGAVRALTNRIDTKLYEQRLVRPFGESANSEFPPRAGISALPGIGPAATMPVDDDAATGLFDTATMRDPRLRAAATIDLVGLERALRQDDHRVALLLLGSVLEAVVLDAVMPRREELGLPMSPDGWDPWALLTRLLGTDLREIDKPTLTLLSRAHQLFRPGCQLVAPTVVVPGLVDRALEFAQRTLRQLGFAAALGEAELLSGAPLPSAVR
jgi:hypothetical protein